jgi:hypothetical protein
MKATGLFFFFLLSITVHSQTWERILGLSNRQETFCQLTESYDKGFLILGRLNDYADSKTWIVKTDINGNVIYDFILGTNNGYNQLSIPEYIYPTSDGGFIVCESFSSDIGIIKMDACGNLEWCKHFSNPDIAWGVKVYQTDDGGYVMLTQGFESYPYYNKSDIHLFRFDEGGNTLWIQPYAERSVHPLIGQNYSADFIITSEGDYFIVGGCGWIDTISGASISKGLSVGAESSGHEKWASVLKENDYSGYLSINSLAQKNTGDFYLGSAFTNGISIPTLVVADSEGNYIYDTILAIPEIDGKVASENLHYPTFFHDDRLFALSQMKDDPYEFPSCIAIHELDTLGGWINSFMNPEATWPFSFIKTFNDKFLIGSTSTNYQDIVLMKLTDSLVYDDLYPFPLNYDYLCPDPIVSRTIDLTDCEVIVNVEDIPTRKEYNARISLIPITSAPNPAKDYIRFLLENTEHHRNIRIVCYDIFGKQMAEFPINSGVNETGLSISGWRHGLYMAVVYSGNKQMGKAKFVVE